MSAGELARRMTAAGFTVRIWRERRVYVAGYGPCIKIYIEPVADPEPRPCDGARIVVESSWASSRSGLHAKGVKHALLQDLYKAGLLSTAPPERWQHVRLDERPRLRPMISPAPAVDELP